MLLLGINPKEILSVSTGTNLGVLIPTCLWWWGGGSNSGALPGKMGEHTIEVWRPVGARDSDRHGSLFKTRNERSKKLLGIYSIILIFVRIQNACGRWFVNLYMC